MLVLIQSLPNPVPSPLPGVSPPFALVSASASGRKSTDRAPTMSSRPREESPPLPRAKQQRRARRRRSWRSKPLPSTLSTLPADPPTSTPNLSVFARSFALPSLTRARRRSSPSLPPRSPSSLPQSRALPVQREDQEDDRRGADHHHLPNPRRRGSRRACIPVGRRRGGRRRLWRTWRRRRRERRSLSISLCSLLGNHFVHARPLGRCGESNERWYCERLRRGVCKKGGYGYCCD